MEGADSAARSSDDTNVDDVPDSGSIGTSCGRQPLPRGHNLATARASKAKKRNAKKNRAENARNALARASFATAATVPSTVVGTPLVDPQPDLLEAAAECQTPPPTARPSEKSRNSFSAEKLCKEKRARTAPDRYSPGGKLVEHGTFESRRGRKYISFADDADGDALTQVAGFRIVGCDVLAELVSNFRCECGDDAGCDIVGETLRGMHSNMEIQCRACNNKRSIDLSNVVRNGKRGRPVSELNLRAVLGTLTKGGHFEALDNLCLSLNTPSMSHGNWDRLVKRIATHAAVLREKALDEVHKAELELAKEEAGDAPPSMDRPTICDGCWAKRSKRKGAGSSRLGAGVLMSARTYGILEIDVRQSYCGVCRSAERRDVVSPHVAEPEQCGLNWRHSAKAMEADICAELLERCPKRRRLRANPVTMDGDATVASRVNNVCSAGVKNGLQFLADVGHSVKNVPDKLANMKRAFQGKIPMPAPPSVATRGEAGAGAHEFDTLTVAALKEKLRQLGLRLSGNKAELVLRLREASATLGTCLPHLLYHAPRLRPTNPRSAPPPC